MSVYKNHDISEGRQ